MGGVDVVAAVQRTIGTYRLLPSGARVVIGVSGGADSVALLHVLSRLQESRQMRLHIVHLDHGLRPESADDAAVVKRLGVQWRLPSTVERRDVQAICAKQGWSLEEGARRIRYQVFLDVARRQSASHIVVAHTADDQAETVLMRLIRGTGLLGLGAIPVMRPLEEMWVVRPLLHVWRRDILAHLASARVDYREDATNHDRRFIRNRIRHELLPLLERDYNLNIKAALIQLAQLSQTDYAYLRHAADRQWRRVVKASPPTRIAIMVEAFLRQPKALQRQLVRRAIQDLRGDLSRFEFRHWLEAEQLFVARPVGTLVRLPGGVQLRREKERVICQVAPEA